MKDIKTLNLDVRESNDQYISVIQFDSNSRILKACITSNGEALDLTNHSVIFSAIKPDGYDIFSECTITNASAGIIDIILSQQALAKGGVMDCQCKIIGADNSVLSTQTFQIHINKSTMSVTMTSSDEYDALIKALAKVQSVDNKAEKLEVEKLSAQLSAQLDTIEQRKADEIDLQVLSERMNKFTSLQQGSTTGDAELIDGRIDNDGITHTNIGSAIRTQIDKVNKTLLKDTKVNLIDRNPIFLDRVLQNLVNIAQVNI